MGSIFAEMPPPIFDAPSGIAHRQEPRGVQPLGSETRLNASQKASSVGFQGLEKSIAAPPRVPRKLRTEP